MVCVSRVANSSGEGKLYVKNLLILAGTCILWTLVCCKKTINQLLCSCCWHAHTRTSIYNPSGAEAKTKEWKSGAVLLYFLAFSFVVV